MLQTQSTIIKHQLSQIADMLILNGTLTECSGLIHGKMGLSIFFFHYARYTENSLFANYALDLISEIQSQIHINSLADYERGIAGIGIGIDYLIQNNFLIIEDDICEGLDQRMIRAVLYDPWLDFSLYRGLTGYGRYWMSRLDYTSSYIPARKCLLYIIDRIEERLSELSIEERVDVFCFLSDLQKKRGFEHCMKTSCSKRVFGFRLVDINHPFTRLGNSTVSNIAATFQHSWYFNGILQEYDVNYIESFFTLDIDKISIDVGLLIGYAGEGLLRLGLIHKMNSSWMLLL